MKTELERIPRSVTENLVADLYFQMESESPKLAEHSSHVAKYTYLLSRFANCPDFVARRIEDMAYLHDIGKLSPAIKPLLEIPFDQEISSADREVFRSHARLGGLMLRATELPLEYSYVTEAHHENFDGTGYPFGLKGDEIPLAAQVIRIADSFAAILERNHTTLAKAKEEIMDGMGTAYNPRFKRPFDRLYRYTGKFLEAKR